MNIFTKHPKEVNMGYFQHMWFAFKLSWLLLITCIATFIHAIFPFLFSKNASDNIKILQSLVMRHNVL